MLFMAGAARLIVAGVFLAAGIAKLANPAATRRMLEEFGVRSPMSPVLTYLLPLAELSVAVAMLWSPAVSWGALAAFLLLVLFTAAVAAALIRGRAPRCNCFGELRSRPVGIRTLVRNMTLAAPPAFLLASDSRVAAALSPTELLLSAALLVLAGAVVILAITVRLLFVRHREIAEAVSLLESHALHEDPARKRTAPEPPRGLNTGVVAPDVMLVTPEGEMKNLGEIREGRPAVLVFVSHGCAPCRELLPRLEAWRQKLERSHLLLVIARGKHSATAELAAAYPHLAVHRSEGDEVGTLYRAEWSPAAVAVGADGRVASETRFGPDAIENLLGSAVEGTGLPEEVEGGIGSPAPAFAATDDRGNEVTHLSIAGTDTVVLHWSNTCGFCAAAQSDLSRWASAKPGTPRLVILTPHAQQLTDRFGASHVIADSGGALARAFGFAGTPSALLIREDGTIGSKVCVGGDEVKSLLGIVTPLANVSGTTS